tara:strand:- start:1112 stop:1459 length:348 start_codon:yes stop_codon:yes gene_type:complete
MKRISPEEFWKRWSWVMSFKDCTIKEMCTQANIKYTNYLLNSGMKRISSKKTKAKMYAWANIPEFIYTSDMDVFVNFIRRQHGESVQNSSKETIRNINTDTSLVQRGKLTRNRIC